MSQSDFSPSRIIDDEHRLLFGKHKGKSIKELTETDPNYLRWLRSQPWGSSNDEFMEQIRHIPNVDLTWGKHKGKTLAWVNLNDPKYIDYLKEAKFIRTEERFKALRDKLKFYLGT